MKLLLKLVMMKTTRMRMKRRAESLKPVSVVTEAAAVVVDQPIGEPDAPSSWFFFLLTHRTILTHSKQTNKAEIYVE